MFSMMLCEHVADTCRMHRSIYSALRSGGEVVHFFPTLFSLPFVFNAVLPETFTRRVLLHFSPQRHDAGLTPKFKALYKGCRGPSRRTRRYYESLGYEVVDYRAFYGHGYFRSVPAIRTIDNWLSSLSCKWDSPFYSSYAYLRLRKPTRQNDV
jgi:hypothetical protein